MRQKYILTLLTFFLIPSFLYAHSPVLQISDNEDGTMEVFGGFSTGQSAAGAKLVIKSAINSKVIYESRVPKSGYLTINVPTEPYTVLLDSGPGHRIEKNGDIHPDNGFIGENKKPLNLAFATTTGLSFLFIFISVFINIRKKRLTKR